MGTCLFDRDWDRICPSSAEGTDEFSDPVSFNFNDEITDNSCQVAVISKVFVMLMPTIIRPLEVVMESIFPMWTLALRKMNDQSLGTP